MNYSFDKNNIKLISDILGADPDFVDNCYTWNIKSKNYITNCSINLFTNIQMTNTNLISIQTLIGYYELHNVKCWNKFSDNEVAFFSDNGSQISVIFISTEYGVSLYAGMDQNILDKDITEIDPSLLLSAMQLNIYNNYKKV
jgi:hypothetical protein